MPRCLNCKEKFIARKFLQKYCTEHDECIAAFVKSRKGKFEAENKKKENREHRIQKEACMTKGEWIELLQKKFNQFIKLRDKDDGCISCDTRNNVRYDAGHFWATTYGFLRFHEDNVHKQCSFNCNKNKHGNQGEYRIRLIKKIGQERVTWLDENRNRRLEITIPEIQELIKVYKEKIKLLKNQ